VIDFIGVLLITIVGILIIASQITGVLVVTGCPSVSAAIRIAQVSTAHFRVDVLRQGKNGETNGTKEYKTKKPG